MGVIHSPLFTEAHGSLGNVIIYKVGNQVRIRAKPLCHRDKKSARQLVQRQKLKKCLQFYRLLDDVFLYSWQLKAKDMIMNGCNLFIKENIRNIDEQGEIADWANLKICAGSFPFPENWQVKPTASGTITLTWNPEVKSALECSDLLHIGAYGFNMDDEEEGKILFRVKDIHTIRKEGQCCFKIPESKDSLHLYACFKSMYTGEYSDSIYLGEWEVEGG